MIDKSHLDGDDGREGLLAGEASVLAADAGGVGNGFATFGRKKAGKRSTIPPVVAGLGDIITG